MAQISEVWGLQTDLLLKEGACELGVWELKFALAWPGSFLTGRSEGLATLCGGVMAKIILQLLLDFQATPCTRH